MHPMTDRERFLATMHYQPRDRAPICDFGFWDETIVLWKDQGLPEWATTKGGHNTVLTDEFFGMDKLHVSVGSQVDMIPHFERIVIEDRGTEYVVRQEDGVLVVQSKFMGSIPMHLGHTLVDRASWKEHYLPRLLPDDPARLPAGETLAHHRKLWSDPQCPVPRMFWAGSLFGRLRDWMGMENIALVPYDDPAWFEEMVTTMADIVVTQLTKLYQMGAVFDCAAFWEDMCYNAGPLLSPRFFQQYLVPQYQRITRVLRAHGVDIIWVDCDGKIDELLPMWLEAGVNCMFPIEVGTWQADPIQFRKQYGQQLLMMGGFDKHILATTPEAITAEVERLTPLVEEGGFIPFCDHRVPPDVSLSNYLHYLREARRVWGLDTNLKPLGELEPTGASV
jgi:uroporphyrinogen decarboxylase